MSGRALKGESQLAGRVEGHDQCEHDTIRAIEPIRTEIPIKSIERTKCIQATNKPWSTVSARWRPSPSWSTTTTIMRAWWWQHYMPTRTKLYWHHSERTITITMGASTLWERSSRSYGSTLSVWNWRPSAVAWDAVRECNIDYQQ